MLSQMNVLETVVKERQQEMLAVYTWERALRLAQKRPRSKAPVVDMGQQLSSPRERVNWKDAFRSLLFKR